MNELEISPIEGEVLPDYKIPAILIKGVNTNYQKSQDSNKQAMVYAIKTGEYLRKIKAKVPHGQWINYLEKAKPDFAFQTRQSAQRYMKLAKNKELAMIVSNPDSVFNLEEMNKAITNASDEDQDEADRLRQIANQTSSNTDQWHTPDYIIEKVKAAMGSISLDPCTSDENHTGADNYFTVDDDGLSQVWEGNVFVNPPYGASSTRKWCDYLIDQNPEQSILLVRNSTGAEYFYRLMNWATAMCLVRGRIDFMAGEGQATSNPTFSSVIFYKGNSLDSFSEQFKTMGVIFKLPPHII